MLQVMSEADNKTVIFQFFKFFYWNYSVQLFCTMLLLTF